MARDYAKKGKATAGRNKPAARKKSSAPAKQATSPWRWYGAGVLTGLFLSFLAWLGTLPPGAGEGVPAPQAGTESAQEPPKPRFDFYTMLPEQSIEVDVEEAEVARPRAGSNTSKPREYYLLQAGSFRQREDADRRRAELLLLGLEPRVEEATGDNGRWYRVYLGPFDSKSKMAKARSLTAQQDIDTLLLKRSG